MKSECRGRLDAPPECTEDVGSAGERFGEHAESFSRLSDAHILNSASGAGSEVKAEARCHAGLDVFANPKDTLIKGEALAAASTSGTGELQWAVSAEVETTISFNTRRTCRFVATYLFKQSGSGSLSFVLDEPNGSELRILGSSSSGDTEQHSEVITGFLKSGSHVVSLRMTLSGGGEGGERSCEGAFTLDVLEP